MLLGMSQEKLGDALGGTFQQIQKYERGTNRISAGRLQSIGDVLGVPPAYFFQEFPRERSPGTGAEDHILDVLGTSEGIRLARAFAAIKDGGLRNRLIDLMDAVAKSALRE